MIAVAASLRAPYYITLSLTRCLCGACACRAEDYETEESSKYVVSYEEMKAKAEEELVSPLASFSQLLS